MHETGAPPEPDEALLFTEELPPSPLLPPTEPTVEPDALEGPAPPAPPPSPPALLLDDAPLLADEEDWPSSFNSSSGMQPAATNTAVTRQPHELEPR